MVLVATVVGMSPFLVRRVIGGPSLLLNILQFEASHVWKLEVRMRVCLNLVDGILIEMVVEEHEQA